MMSEQEEAGAGLEDVIRPGLTRGLDFVIIDELRKRTGITPDSILKFALGEMLCNSLDKDATKIDVNVRSEGKFYRLKISDNGSKKLTREEIDLILNFEYKASSKRGFLRVSRGYLGNALKCAVGYSYALAESKGLTPPDIVVKSAGTEYRIALKPNRVKGVIESKIVTVERNDDGRTTFIVKFPRRDLGDEEISELRDLIFASSVVNPSRKISYNIFGEKGMLGSAEGDKVIRRETSVLWYTEKQFQSLFEDYLRTRPKTQLKGFVSLFRGFTSKNVIREILQNLGSGNHDSWKNPRVQFFPATPIQELSTGAVSELFRLMRAKAKPIAKRSIGPVLGFVGEKSFERIREQYGWKRLRYVRIPGTRTEHPGHYYPVNPFRDPDYVKFPYLIELAVFDRKADGEGLKVYQCVDFMASTEDIFSKIFDIDYRLGRVGISEEAPVTVVTHLVCPVLKWLNYGKGGLDDENISPVMERAFDKILPIPKTPRVYHPPPPPKPFSWIPSGGRKFGTEEYDRRLKYFAAKILDIDSKRSKTLMKKLGPRSWGYYFEGMNLITKGQIGTVSRAIADCRKRGFLPIDFTAEDPNTTRRFTGFERAADPVALLRELRDQVADSPETMASLTTDFWKEEKYFVMLVTEKGDMIILLGHKCKIYHIPKASSAGWYVVHTRAAIAKMAKLAEAMGMTPVLLLFYDLDPGGWKISETFRKGLEDCSGGTGWRPDSLIIERIGLNPDQVKKCGLTWINNLKSGSGKEIGKRDPETGEIHDWDFERVVADEDGNPRRRKCELNAFFRNDETMRAAQEIFRRAVEKYYGSNAVRRFKRKEGRTKQKLKAIYKDPVWNNFLARLDRLIESFPAEKPKGERQTKKPAAEKEVEVTVNRGYYGRCPECDRSFDYDDEDIGKLMRCRGCSIPMRLRMASRGKKR